MPCHWINCFCNGFLLLWVLLGCMELSRQMRLRIVSALLLMIKLKELQRRTIRGSFIIR